MNTLPLTPYIWKYVHNGTYGLTTSNLTASGQGNNSLRLTWPLANY
ncbi:hypothetical protein [Shewanella sp.]